MLYNVEHLTRTDINRLSSRVVLTLSLIALGTVLSGYLDGSYRQPPGADEGAAAHIFQLSIVAVVPALLLFLGTAEWRNRMQAVRPLLVPAVVLAISFVALYYLEHPAR